MPPHEVHVWYRATDSLDRTAVDAAVSSLSGEERAQFNRFRFAPDARDYAAAHDLLRRMLSHHDGRAPGRWRFGKDAGGKPFLIDQGAFRAAFSLSHTRGMVASAVTAGADVGVDVECIDRRVDAAEIAARFFAPAEAARLTQLDEDARRGHFFDLWTLKEALVKALGTGMAMSLNRLAFDVGPDGAVHLDAPADIDADSWQFGLFAPGPRHRLAVAVRRDPSHPAQLIPISRRRGVTRGVTIRGQERFMFTRLVRALLHVSALFVVIFTPVALDLGPRVTAQVPAATDSPRYVLPPKAIVDAFDAEPLPQTLLSPNKQVVALTKARTYPTIAELAQPMYRLAGSRVNPKTNGPHRASGLPGTGIYTITLKKISDGAEVPVKMPPQARISQVKFSPDGSHLAFLQTKDDAIELWIADGLTGASKAVVTGADRINATTGDPCDWLKDNATMVCELVPAGRGPAPAEPLVPSGPHVEENYGKAAPAPTYEDLLKTAHDDALFDYYFTSQLAAINVTSGAKTTIGRPAVFANVTPAPGGQHLLVMKIKKPFSHTVPMNGFAQDVEIWTRAGEVAKHVADQPSREGTGLTGVETGPRSYRWRADQPSTLLWAEALDGGDLKNKVPFRDKVVALAPPFTAQPVEVAKTEWRYGSINYTDAGLALLTENDRASRRTRSWILEPGAAPRKVWDRKQDAAYDDPGTPVTRRDTGAASGGGRGGAGGGSIIQNGDYIYVAGVGASKEGDRPFLDKLNVKTLKSERIFRSSAESLESFVAPLNDEMTRFLTRYETQKDAPNYFTRDAGADAKRAVTQFKDPQPLVRDILRQYVTYKRNDGVTLSGTLYLPPGYKQGTKVPVIMWAYPREFGDADSASQVSGSPNSFTTIRGGSHMFLLLSGYAIFDNPTMPIIGPGETANDTYVEQLVASAQAAVDKVVEMGVTDRDRIGVGGHSYGGFMTANLLAHSRLFRAGFAESGAYMRTLTPFGFQAERRSFWEVPELYARMSPFWYADKIKDPILLMHGEMDDNTGTFPINSERLYAALKGHGATVRLVMLPNEAHGYAARETLLHVIAERLNWFDKYVKNAGAKSTTDAQR